MAGYLITLNDETSLRNCIYTGTYSTILKAPRFNSWQINHEGTFADYLSMNENDYVFFFIQRRIYGIGRLKKIGYDCKYLNFIGADSPSGNDTPEANQRLLQYGSSENRCFCLFEPAPAFFKNGVDMDEVLQHRDCPFRSLRTLWKLSFIKLDDDESAALFSIILRHNECNIRNETEHYAFNPLYHETLALNDLTPYRLSYAQIVDACKSQRTTALKHEMAIEATLCEKLTHEGVEPFGQWDYISHQVAASPFKPVDYMDKMDIFGYRFIQGFKVVSKYLIAELKKDAATIDVVGQIMKYVDWVADEYVNGDYSMIEAFIVANDFSDEVIDSVRQHCIRNFNKGFRPTQFCTWNSVKLVKYDATDGNILFTEINVR